MNQASGSTHLVKKRRADWGNKWAYTGWADRQGHSEIEPTLEGGKVVAVETDDEGRFYAYAYFDGRLALADEIKPLGLAACRIRPTLPDRLTQCP